jgi:hypothetical protein
MVDYSETYQAIRLDTANKALRMRAINRVAEQKVDAALTAEDAASPNVALYKTDNDVRAAVDKVYTDVALGRGDFEGLMPKFNDAATGQSDATMNAIAQSWVAPYAGVPAALKKDEDSYMNLVQESTEASAEVARNPAVSVAVNLVASQAGVDPRGWVTSIFGNDVDIDATAVQALNTNDFYNVFAGGEQGKRAVQSKLLEATARQRAQREGLEARVEE